MKKVINRFALILLCAVVFLGGCKQETNEPTTTPEKENPMKNWVVGTWREAKVESSGDYSYAFGLSNSSNSGGSELEIKNDGTWININYFTYSDWIKDEKKGTWEFDDNDGIIVKFIRDDGFVTLGSFTSGSNGDLLMINDEIYKRYY